MHIYFDREGAQSEAYYREKSEDYKAIAQPLPVDKKAIIDQLMLNFATPLVHRLNECHADKITTLSKPYYQGLLDIRTRLFEQTMDVDENLSIMRNLIDLGESLNRINYHAPENRISLKYLKKQHAGILKLKEAIVSDISDAPTLAAAFDHEEQDHTNMIEPTLLNLRLSVHKPEENAELLCQSFEASYDKINTLIQSYDTLPFNDFSGKVKILDDASPALLDLFIKAESLMELDPAMIRNPMVLYKSGPGLDCLFNSCKNKGTFLLTLCLLSTKERLQTFGAYLTKYAPFVSSDCVDSVLRKGYADALLYLIKHGSVAINRHQFTVSAEKTMLSLVSAAYRLEQLECFTVLIKHNANVFVLYEDALPLAHTLFNLPFSNPYRQAFIEHSPYFPNKTSQFFSIIMPMLQDKLLSDPEITSKQSDELSQSLELYQTIVESGNISTASKRVTRQATQICQRIDQNVLEDLRKSPEYIDRVGKTLALTRQLNRLLKKQKQESRFKAQNSLFFKDINQKFDDSEFLQQQLLALGKEQLLQSMDANNAALEDYIFVLTNQGKSLSRKERKLHDAAIERINSGPMQPKSKSAQKATELLSKIIDSLDKFNASLKAYSEQPAPAHSEEDEYRGVDFWEVAGCERDETIASLAPFL